VRSHPMGRVGAAQIRKPGARSKLSFGAILMIAIGLAVIVLGGSASAAEQAQVSSFGTAGSGAGQMNTPAGVAVDQSTGDFYVADSQNQRIDKFGPTGAFLLAWGWGVENGAAELQTCTTTCQSGTPGQGPGQMETPTSIAVAPNGDVYVLNQSFFDGRVEWFSPTGEFEGAFGGYGTEPDEFTFQLSPANDLAIDSNGRVFVSDTAHAPSRIAIFSATGTFEGSIDREPGHRVESPGALAVGVNDELFVASTESGISVYAPNGEFLRVVGRGAGAQALAVNPENGNLLVALGKGLGPNSVWSLTEYAPSGQLIGSGSIPLTPSEFSFASTIGLAYDANPAADAPGSNPGLVLAADLNGGRVLGLAEPAPAQPSVEGTAATGIGSDAANVSASVNPHGLATRYFVEYGTTSAYGSTTALTPLPPTHKGEHATVHLAGLAPGTTYHYSLVAENALGTESSLDRTFTTLSTGSPFTLPDGRIYELVSPAQKGNNDIESRGITTANGEAVSYSALNGLPGAEAGALLGATVAARGGSGWSSVPASPPTENESTLLASTPIGFSADLRQAMVQSPLNLTGNAQPGWNFYLRTNPSAPGQPAGEQLMTTEGARFGCATLPTPVMIGSSADFSHVVFTEAAALTAASTDLSPPNAGAFECGPAQLYEWDAGTLRNIGILPGASTPSPTGVTAISGAGSVSSDGSRVFFDAKPEPVAPGEIVQPQLFLRSGGTTIKVSSPNVALTEPNLSPVTFQGASADGSVAYFTTEAHLTADASPAGADLYRYEVASGQLTDLTPTTGTGAGVRQALVSADGSTVYFGATGALTADATEGNNLYRVQGGGSPTFIGQLGPSDSFMSSFPFAPMTSSARTTVNGDVLILGSESTLGTDAENTGIFGNSATEIYRFGVGQGVTCVSCANRGEPVAGARVAEPAFPGSTGGNVLSADGNRVFFETPDALVPQDNNGKGDVYEWEAGQVHLISTGSSGSESKLVDADATGNNLFFTTRQSLVTADQDEKFDVYDARVGGGFAEAPAVGPPCEAEACRPPLEAAPPAPQLGSKSFVGPPNQKHKKHPKKKHHKKHHHKKKHKHHKKSSHGRGNTTGKRG
jgi:NHL repeat-containing protein